MPDLETEPNRVSSCKNCKHWRMNHAMKGNTGWCENKEAFPQPVTQTFPSFYCNHWEELGTWAQRVADKLLEERMINSVNIYKVVKILEDQMELEKAMEL